MTEFIQNCPLFNGIEAEEAGMLIEGCVIRTAENGEVLDNSNMYIILSGSLLIEKEASDGRIINMRSAEAGNVVNAANVLIGDRNMSRLTASGQTEVIEVTGGKVRDMISKGGRFAVNFTEFLSDRISFLNKKISSIGGYSAASRLLMYLEENAVKGEAVLPMKFGDFASYLGVSRAGLYRAFESLEDRGEIERSGKRIKLLNRK